jgi:hypothetical protein
MLGVLDGQCNGCDDGGIRTSNRRLVGWGKWHLCLIQHHDMKTAAAFTMRPQGTQHTPGRRMWGVTDKTGTVLRERIPCLTWEPNPEYSLLHLSLVPIPMKLSTHITIRAYTGFPSTLPYFACCCCSFIVHNDTQHKGQLTLYYVVKQPSWW